MYKYKKIRKFNRDEHRIIMETHLGRTLSRQEVVHHKDENGLNNDISNLEVMSLAEHTRLHKTGKPLSKAHKDKLRAASMGNIPTNRKFSSEQAVLIREHWMTYAGSLRNFSKLYNVGRTSMNKLLNRSRYK